MSTIILLFFVLLVMNCLTEYLLNKVLSRQNIMEEKHLVFHMVIAALRIAWVFSGTWFSVRLPFFLTGLLILLMLNMAPYPDRRLPLINFNIIVFLIFTSLLMTVISVTGVLGIDMGYMIGNIRIRGIMVSTTFLVFNILSIFFIRNYPEYLWQKDYDKFNVKVYTRFLCICIVYHILDSVILTACQLSRFNYMLFLGGDILILILIFNFLNYNYIFAKSEEVRREYEESEVLFAQQYFEKESLKKISGFDFLTNAYTRREISSVMTENIRNGQELVCVFIDLDGLKRTNDKYGHTFGDLMLKKFADTCVEIMEGNGCLARIGGDEFLLVFPDGKISDVEARIKRLQLKLLEPSDSKEKISFSYGISCGEETVDNYIGKADQRMYADKNRKKRGNL